jgi:hypothetical protein
MKKSRLMVFATVVIAFASAVLGAGCFGTAASTTTATTAAVDSTTTTTAVVVTTTTSTVAVTGTTSTEGASSTSTEPGAGTTASDTSTTGSTGTTTTVTFTAALSGEEVVPAVSTTATGSATFTFESTLTRAYFVLKVSNLADVTASRLKQGKPGTNGQGVLILYPGPTIPGLHTAVLAQGWFDSTALIGPLYGKTIADLKALLEKGEAYVNVGTDANPDGEIRGQVK